MTPPNPNQPVHATLSDGTILKGPFYLPPLNADRVTKFLVDGKEWYVGHSTSAIDPRMSDELCNWIRLRVAGYARRPPAS